MSLEDAQASISAAVYAATALLEVLEHAGKCSGNGHHARQVLAGMAEAELASRWMKPHRA